MELNRGFGQTIPYVMGRKSEDSPSRRRVVEALDSRRYRISLCSSSSTGVQIYRWVTTDCGLQRLEQNAGWTGEGVSCSGEPNHYDIHRQNDLKNVYEFFLENFILKTSGKIDSFTMDSIF